MCRVGRHRGSSLLTSFRAEYTVHKRIPARFLKKYDGICRIFMQMYTMKFKELAKIAGNCKNCSLMKKMKNNSPNTLLSLGYYLNVKSNFLLLSMISSILHHRKCWEYLSSQLVLFQTLINTWLKLTKH